MLERALEIRLEGLQPGEGLLAPGLSNEAYHTGPGLSHSGAKRLLRTPFHFHALNRAREAPMKAPTPAMFNGTLVHCALLEPDQFDLRYVVAEGDKRSSQYKRFAEQLAGSGLEPITQLQRDQAFAQADALRSLPDVAHLLSHGQAEISVYWRDPAHGVLLKCRPDWVSPVGHGNGAILLDVKTTTDASPEEFQRTVAKFGYHTQADWYCEGYRIATGLEVHGMVFAVVESEYPYACKPYMLSDRALEKAAEINRRARKLYADCLQAQQWPSYAPDIQVIDLPAWA